MAGIYTLSDLRRAANAAGIDGSDEDLIKNYADRAGVNPVEIANRLGYDGGASTLTRERLSSSADSYQANMYGLGEAVSGALGATQAADWFKRRRQTNEFQSEVASQRASALGGISSYKDVDWTSPSQIGNYMGGLAAQSAPYLAEAALSGGVGAMALRGGALGLSRAGAGRLGAVVGSYPSAVGDILQNQREAGDGRMDLGTAMAGGVPYAALNAVGLEGALAAGRPMARIGAFGDGVGGLRGGALRLGKNAAIQGGIEGATEVGQEMINQQAGRMAMNPNETLFSPDAIERYKESFVGGGLLGGGASATLGGWRRSEGYQGPQDLLNPPAPTPTPVRDALPPSMMGQLAQGFDPNPNRLGDFVPAGPREGSRVLAMPEQGALGDTTPDWGLSQGVNVADRRDLRGVDPSFPTDAGGMQGAPGVDFDYDFDSSAVRNPQLPRDPHAVLQRMEATDPGGLQGMPGVDLPPLIADQYGVVAGGPFEDSLTRQTEPGNRGQQELSLYGRNDGDLGLALARERAMAVRTTQQTTEDAARARATAPDFFKGQKAGGRRGVANKIVGDGAPDGVAQRMVAKYQEYAADETKREYADSLAAWYTAFTGKDIKAQGAQPNVSVPSGTGQRPAGNGDGRSAVTPGSVADAGPNAAAAVGSAAPDGGVRTDAAPNAAVQPVGRGGAPAVTEQPAAPVAKPRVVARNGDSKYPITVDRIPGGWRVSLDELTGVTGLDVQSVNDIDTAARVAEAPTSEEAVAKLNEQLNAWADSRAAEAAAKRLEGNIADRVERADGSLDMALLRKALGDDPRMLLAARLHLGVKDDGTAFEGEPLTQKAAADTANLGKNSGARVSNALRAVGINTGWIKGFHARRGAVEATATIIDPDLAESAGVVDSPGKAQGAVETPRPGLISAMPWYKAAMDEKATPAAAIEGLMRASMFNIDPKAGAREAAANRNAQQALAEKAAQAVKGMSRQEQAKLMVAVEAKLGRTKETANETAEAGADLESDDAQRAEAAGAEDSGTDEGSAAPQTQSNGPEASGRPNQVARSQTAGAGATTLERNQTTLVDRAWVENQPPFAAAIKTLKDMGLGHMMDWISEWRSLGNSGRDVAEGWLEADGPRYVLTLKESSAYLSEFDAAWVLLHELAHAADLAVSGGVYAVHPDLAFVEKDGLFVAKGAVAQELANLYAEGGLFMHVLNYPLNPKYGTETAAETSGEVFAQLFAMYANPKGKLRLEADAPLAFRFMEEAVNDIQKNRPTRIRTPGETAARQKAFVGRYRGVSSDQSAGAAPRVAGADRASAVRVRAAPSSAAAAVAALPDHARSQPRAKVDQRISSLHPALRPAARGVWNVLSRLGRKALNASIFTEDLLNRAYDLGIKSADRYKELANKRTAFTGAHERVVLDTVNGYKDLPANEQGKGPGTANDFLYRSTMARKWGYQPQWLAEPVEVDPEMAAAYDKMSAGGKKFIDDVFRLGYESLQEKKALVREVTASEYDALIAAEPNADARAELEAERDEALKTSFGSLMRIGGKEPYAPIKRFGNFVVVAESAEYQAAYEAGDTTKLRELESQEEHYFVDFAETQADAERVLDKLKATGNYTNPVYREREMMRDQLYGGSKTLAAIGKLRARAEMMDDSRGGSERRALVKALTDLYLLQLAEDSARKSEINRRGIAGDIDMIRSLETQGLADASFMGAIKYSQPMLETLNQMRREMRTGSGSEPKVKSEVLNEIIARHIQSMDYTPTPWANRLVRATSLWFLSTSPSYYIQNATQPWMMSLPMMAAKHGYTKAGAALTQAYRDIVPAFRNSKVLEQLNFDALLGAASPLAEGEKQALRDMLNTGRLDIGMLTELGEARVEPANAAMRTWNKVDSSLRGMQLKLEAINRVTSALAAYRLETADTTKLDKAAYDYADDILQQTHGDYSAWNAPRAFNTGFGKVALQFRKFQLIQLTLMAKMLSNSFNGASPEERKVARKALAFTLGQAFLVGGGKALPIPFVIGWLFAKAFGEDADEPPEYVLRKMIGDKDTADLLINGAPAWLAGVNGAALGGMSNALSLAPFADFDLTKREKATEYAFTLLSGPLGGLYLRAADGVGYIANGDYYRGLENLLPKGISSLGKAYRTTTEGVSQRDGDMTMSPDEITAWDGIQQALGFTPSRQLERMYRQDAAFRITKGVQADASSIKAEYARARREGDTEAAAAARESWMEYQDRRVELGFARQPLSELLKVEQDQAKRVSKTVGNVQYNKTNERFVRELAER